MKFPIKTTIFLLVLTGAGVAGCVYLPDYWKNMNKPKFRRENVSRGSIVTVVNATGTIKPVLSIKVGAFVSGPIEKLYVDYNDIVKKDQLLAKIDPRIFQANVDRDSAQLATRKAEEKRVWAMLEQAKRDEKRAVDLRDENKEFISEAELDKFKYSRMSLEAQLLLAKAAIQQANAALKKSKTDLNYTKIVSPVDGIILERKIEKGETLASTFQTPELFVLAPDLKTMHIHATVDEADISLITAAQKKGLPVRFTVDSEPNDLFTGTIYQIRNSSTTTQNVVTYPVIVETKNPDMKLRPGMTASLSFQVDEVKNAIRIPNAALRFFPERKHVRSEDHPILDGTERVHKQTDDTTQAALTAKEKAEARRSRHRRHVWVEDGEFLKAVEVRVGISNNKFTQLLKGGLQNGQKLVTGLRTK